MPALGESSSSKMIKCYVLEERNQILGNCTVYASPKIFKVVFANKKWIDIARAPNWDLYVYSPASKLYCIEDLKKWKGATIFFDISRINNATKIVKTNEHKKIAGIDAVKYAGSGSDTSRGEVATSQYWIADGLGLPKQVGHVVSGNVGIPHFDGVPLRAVAQRADEGEMTMLDTISAKVVNVPESFFNPPPGFKLADKRESVMSGGVMSILEDLAK
jgi:hypothetical protein